MVVEVPWIGVVGAGDGTGKYSEGSNLPGLETLFALSSIGARSSSVPESLRWVYLFPSRSMEGCFDGIVTCIQLRLGS